jgi:hypothetical protein
MDASERGAMDNENLTYEQKDILLRWFEYRISMEDRHELMRTYPALYNAWAGEDVVRVVRVSDGQPV